MQEKLSSLEAIIGMALTGLIIGLGQVLASEEKITPRIIIGRALSSMGLALVAGIVLIQIPDIHILALIGLSALIASLGTSALEKLFQKYFGVGK
ncbi:MULTISPECIES: hypothetical protein [unclassified Thioalkalivibrio]|uniref:hypothetical protein n=1 Tax=unclassified Thioalkalivibrio TaxID=2621013 RepID=UPI00036C484A|nr:MULTISPECIES: hypothetical protein [unclassified Thioalkalivibrio]